MIDDFFAYCMQDVINAVMRPSHVAKFSTDGNRHYDVVADIDRKFVTKLYRHGFLVNVKFSKRLKIAIEKGEKWLTDR